MSREIDGGEASGRFYFVPKRLQATKKAVKKAHPRKLTDYQSPEFARSDAAAKLVKRLMATPIQELNTLVTTLSPQEEALFCGLIHRQEPAVQERVLRAMTFRPELGNSRLLWPYLEDNYPTERSRLAAQVLRIGSIKSKESLGMERVKFVDRYATGHRELQIFWKAIADSGRIAQEFQSPSLFAQKSALGQAMEKFVYQKGWYDLWKALPRAEFIHRFELMPQSDAIETMIQGWRISNQIRPERAPYWVDTFLNQLGLPGNTWWRELEKANPDAAAWYRSLRVAIELAAFFDDVASESERVRFWKRYQTKNLIRQAAYDREYQRLFLDFGGFGVVEFVEVGNASYIYPIAKLEELQAMNFRDEPRSHSELKIPEAAHERLTHRGNWQARFDMRIHGYLRYYQS